MKRHPLLLSPLLAAFLICSPALPPQSAYDRGSQVRAAGNGEASSSRSHALRVQSSGEASGLEELLEQLTAPFKTSAASGLEENPNPVARLTGPLGAITSLLLAQEGKKVLAGSADNLLYRWDVPGGSSASEGQKAGKILASAVSRDGRWVAVGTQGGTVALRDIDSGETRWSHRAQKQSADKKQVKHSGDILAVAFNPDGSRVISVSKDGTVRFLDAEHGSLQGVVSFQADWVVEADFLSDRKRLVTVDANQAVRVWGLPEDQTRFQLRKSFEKAGKFTHAAFTPDGEHVVLVASDNSVGLREISTTALERSFRSTGNPVGHTTPIQTVAVGPDGVLLASADQAGRVLLWDLATGERVSVLSGHQQPVTHLAFSPDGGRIASGDSAGLVQIWDNPRRPEAAPVRSKQPTIREPETVDQSQAAPALDLVEEYLLSEIGAGQDPWLRAREGLPPANEPRLRRILLEHRDASVLVQVEKVVTEFKAHLGEIIVLPFEILGQAVKFNEADGTIYFAQETLEQADLGAIGLAMRRRDFSPLIHWVPKPPTTVPPPQTKSESPPETTPAVRPARAKLKAAGPGAGAVSPKQLSVGTSSPGPVAADNGRDTPAASLLESVPPSGAERPIPGERFATLASLKNRLAIIAQTALAGEILFPNEIMHDEGQNRVAADVTDTAARTFQFLPMRGVRVGVNLMPVLPTSAWLGDPEPVPTRYVAELRDSKLSLLKTIEKNRPQMAGFIERVSDLLMGIRSREGAEVSVSKAADNLRQIAQIARTVTEGRSISGGIDGSAAERIEWLKSRFPERAQQVDDAVRLIGEAVSVDRAWHRRFQRAEKILQPAGERSEDGVPVKQVREALGEFLKDAQRGPDLYPALPNLLGRLPDDDGQTESRSQWLDLLKELRSSIRAIALMPAWSSLPAGVLQAVYYDAVRLTLEQQLRQVETRLDGSTSVTVLGEVLEELTTAALLVEANEAEAALTRYIHSTARPVGLEKVFPLPRPQFNVGVLFIAPDGSYRLVPGGGSMVQDVSRSATFHPTAIREWAQPGERVVLLCACGSSRGTPHPVQQLQIAQDLSILRRFLPDAASILLGTVTADGTLRLYEPAASSEDDQASLRGYRLAWKRVQLAQQFSEALQKASDISRGNRKPEQWRVHVLRVLTGFARPSGERGILIHLLSHYAPEVAEEAHQDIRDRFQRMFEQWETLSPLISPRITLTSRGMADEEMRMQRRFVAAQSELYGELPRIIDIAQEWIGAPAIEKGVLFREIPVPSPASSGSPKGAVDAEVVLKRLIGQAAENQGWNQAEVEAFSREWRGEEGIEGRLAQDDVKQSDFNKAFLAGKKKQEQKAERLHLEQEAAARAQRALEEAAKAQEQREIEVKVADQIAGFEKIFPLDAQGVAAALVGSAQFRATLSDDFYSRLDQVVTAFSERVIAAHEEFVKGELDLANISAVQKEETTLGQLFPVFGETANGERLKTTRASLQRRFVVRALDDLDAAYNRFLQGGSTPADEPERFAAAEQWAGLLGDAELSARLGVAKKKRRGMDLFQKGEALLQTVTHRDREPVTELIRAIQANATEPGSDPALRDLLYNRVLGPLAKRFDTRMDAELKRIYGMLEEKPGEAGDQLIAFLPKMRASVKFLHDFFDTEGRKQMRVSLTKAQETVETIARYRAEKAGASGGSVSHTIEKDKKIRLIHRASGRFMDIQYTGEVTHPAPRVQLARFTVSVPTGWVAVEANDLSLSQKSQRDWREALQLKAAIKNHRRALEKGDPSVKQEVTVRDAPGEFLISGDLWIVPLEEMERWFEDPNVIVSRAEVPGKSRVQDLPVDFWMRLDTISEKFKRVTVTLENPLGLFGIPPPTARPALGPGQKSGLEEGEEREAVFRQLQQAVQRREKVEVHVRQVSVRPDEHGLDLQISLTPEGPSVHAFLPGNEIVEDRQHQVPLWAKLGWFLGLKGRSVHLVPLRVHTEPSSDDGSAVVSLRMPMEDFKKAVQPVLDELHAKKARGEAVPVTAVVPSHRGKWFGVVFYGQNGSSLGGLVSNVRMVSGPDTRLPLAEAAPGASAHRLPASFVLAWIDRLTSRGDRLTAEIDEIEAQGIWGNVRFKVPLDLRETVLEFSTAAEELLRKISSGGAVEVNILSVSIDGNSAVGFYSGSSGSWIPAFLPLQHVFPPSESIHVNTKREWLRGQAGRTLRLVPLEVVEPNPQTATPYALFRTEETGVQFAKRLEPVLAELRNQDQENRPVLVTLLEADEKKQGAIVFYQPARGPGVSGYLPMGEVGSLPWKEAQEWLDRHLGGLVDLYIKKIEPGSRTGQLDPEIYFRAQIHPQKGGNTEEQLRNAWTQGQPLTVLVEQAVWEKAGTQLLVRAPETAQSAWVFLPSSLVAASAAHDLGFDAKSGWVLGQAGKEMEVFPVHEPQASGDRFFWTVEVKPSREEIQAYLNALREEVQKKVSESGSVPVRVLDVKPLSGALVRYDGSAGVLVGFLPLSKATADSNPFATPIFFKEIWLNILHEDKSPLSVTLQPTDPSDPSHRITFLGAVKMEDIQANVGESRGRLGNAIIQGTVIQARLWEAASKGIRLLYRDPRSRTWFLGWIPYVMQKQFDAWTVQYWASARIGREVDVVPVQLKDYRGFTEIVFRLSDPAKTIAQAVRPALDGLKQAWNAGEPVTAVLGEVTQGGARLDYYSPTGGQHKAGFLPRSKITAPLDQRGEIDVLLGEVVGKPILAWVLEMNWQAGGLDAEVIFGTDIQNLRQAAGTAGLEESREAVSRTRALLEKATQEERPIKVHLHRVEFQGTRTYLEVAANGGLDSVTLPVIFNSGKFPVRRTREWLYGWRGWLLGREKKEIVLVPAESPGSFFVQVSAQEVEDYLHLVLAHLQADLRRGSVNVRVVGVRPNAAGAEVRYDSTAGSALGFMPSRLSLAAGDLKPDVKKAWWTASQEDRTLLPVILVGNSENGLNGELIFKAKLAADQVQPKSDDALQRLRNAALDATVTSARVISVEKLELDLLYRDPEDRTWFPGVMFWEEGLAIKDSDRPFELSTLRDWADLHGGKDLEVIPTEIRTGAVRTVHFRLNRPEEQVGGEIRPALDELKAAKKSGQKLKVTGVEAAATGNGLIVRYKPTRSGLPKQGFIPASQITSRRTHLTLAQLKTLMNQAVGISFPAQVFELEWREGKLDAALIFTARFEEIDHAIRHAGLEEGESRTNQVFFLDAGLLDPVVTADPYFDLTLTGLTIDLKRVIGWDEPEMGDLQIALVSEENRAELEKLYVGFQVAEIRRQPDSDSRFLPVQAIPSMILDALESGRGLFSVVVTPYLDLGNYSLPDVWQILAEQYT